MIPFRKSIFRNIVLWYTLCVSVVIGFFAWLLYDEIERGRRKPFEVRLVSQSAFLSSRLYHTDHEVYLAYPYLPDADLSNSFFAVYSTNWQPLLVSVPWRRVRWSPGILKHKKLAERVAANKSYYGTAKDDRDEDMRFCVTRKLLKPPPETLSFSAESGDELEVYIVCAALYEPIDQYLGFRRHRLLTTALILCAVILLSGLGVALLGVRPIVRLARAARAITPEDPRTRFPVDKLPDELRYLADRTNEAFNRLDAALASERHFTAAAAHEMRSPVAELVARLDVLRRGDDITPELKDKVDRIYADAERLRKLSGQLLLLARLDRAAAGEPFQRREVDLNDIAIDAADFCRAKAHDRDIGITVNSRGDTIVQGREEWLLRAVYNHRRQRG